MASESLKEFLHQECSSWHADGEIDQFTRDTLQTRWESSGGYLPGLIRSLGIAGALIAFFGVMGAAAAMTRSAFLAAFFLLASGGALSAWALRLYTDLAGRFVVSSKALLLVGMVAIAVGIGFLLHALGLREQAFVVGIGMVVLPLVFFLAYRFRNSWLLGLAVLCLFHWVGAWQMMFGPQTREFTMHDSRVMSIAAAAAFLVGIRHEDWDDMCAGSFARVWKAIGLVYLNVNLLMTTLRSSGETGLLWSALLGLLCLVQIVVGARRHDAMVRGFGIVFFILNAFTRFHESSWSRLELGTYFFAGGMVLLATGVALEAGMRWLDRQGGAA